MKIWVAVSGYCIYVSHSRIMVTATFGKEFEQAGEFLSRIDKDSIIFSDSRYRLMFYSGRDDISGYSLEKLEKVSPGKNIYIVQHTQNIKRDHRLPPGARLEANFSQNYIYVYPYLDVVPYSSGAFWVDNYQMKRRFSILIFHYTIPEKSNREIHF